MGQYVPAVNGDRQPLCQLGDQFTGSVDLPRRGRILAEFSIFAVMWQRAAGAAEGDTNGAGVAVPGVAFKLGELGAGLVNAAVGVDVEVVIVVKLAVASCRPVQVDL